MIIAPSHAKYHYPTREDNLLVCDSYIDASYMIAFFFPILLIIVCTVYAVLTRKIPEAFNESKHIGFTMYTTCVIWLAFVPLYFATANHVPLRITSMSVTISLSALVCMACLFTPKVSYTLTKQHPTGGFIKSFFVSSTSFSSDPSAMFAKAWWRQIAARDSASLQQPVPLRWCQQWWWPWRRAIKRRRFNDTCRLSRRRLRNIRVTTRDLPQMAIFCDDISILLSCSLADNTSLNNNNNNHSLNNNTITYSDKSTQTAADCDECEASLKPSMSKDELITAETQTDFTNLHSESICCLNSIPYADMTNSPPPPPPVPYRRVHDRKITENCNENHRGDDNHAELNQLSARNLQYSIDTSIGAATQTALAAVAGGVCDNGDVPRKTENNVHGENL